MNPVPGEVPWCLVLSGGGAKGVFHIGAWRALREIGLPVQAFVGNSIGALMAAFLAAGKGAELAAIGRTITVDTLLALPNPKASVSQWWDYFLAHGGLDTSPMRRLLEEHVHESALRTKGIDLGLVTVNITDRKPLQVFLDEMEPGSLIDYLMASAAFPGFASPRIGGKHFVDGGLWDNLPYDLARSRGWRRIILLDVSGLGWNRRPEIEGSLTVYVKASIEMGGPFDFDPAFLERYERLGYLDTLRAFGYLLGDWTFLRPDPVLERRWGPTLPVPPKHDQNRVARLLDAAAAALEVERVQAWTYTELASALAHRRQEEEASIATTLEGTGRRAGGPRRESLLAPIHTAIQAGALTASPYRTLRLVRELSTGSTRRLLENMLMTLHPALPASNEYWDWIDQANPSFV